MCSEKGVKKSLKHTSSKRGQLRMQTCNFTEIIFLAAIFKLFYQHSKSNFRNTSNGIFHVATC